MSQYATPEIPEENADFFQRAAQGAAVGAAQQPIDAPPAGPLDPDLAAVVDAWPALPEAVRERVVKLVRKARGGASGTP